MAEYIEREAAIATIQNIQGPILSREVRTLREITAADVVEVKHGKWVNERELAGGFRSIWGYDCSVCGHTVENYPTNYCPNCGAKMDLKGE